VQGLAVLACGLFLAADLDRARALLREERTAEALREIQSTTRALPDDPEIQYEAGTLLRELGAKRAARLEELAPDSAEVHELIGRSLETRGKLEEALAEYRAALSKDPQRVGVHALVGNVLWKQRDFSGARAEMERELNINPSHSVANLRLGQILLSMDQPREAAVYLRAAIHADSSSTEAHLALGKACRALDAFPEALKEFRLVAEKRPNDTTAHAQLAAIYRAMGDQNRSKAESEILRRLLQRSAEAGRTQ